MHTNNSNSILDSKGKILFFGLQDFIDHIANGDCCFVCGAIPGTKEFNKEHIIPDWILKRYGLYSKSITLPNGSPIKYSQYTVPCCKECNSALNEYYEKPISRLLSKSYKQICKSLDNDSELYHLLFKWLCLIYLKTHLKDKTLKWDRDERQNSLPISSIFYWEEIHHVHCIARSHYTGAKIDEKAYGTIFILPAICVEGIENFDYGDNQLGKGVLMQLGQFSIIAVLNDAHAGLTLWGEQFKKIKGPVTHLQLREIFSHLNYININLKVRPVFQSLFSYDGEYLITAEVPEYAELVDKESEAISVGSLLRHYVEPLIPDTDSKDQLLSEIEEGKRGYLFDIEGKFIDYRTE